MKALLLTVASFVSAALVCAQTPARQQPFKGAVRPAIVVPMSARPVPALRASTAQGAAARINKPPLRALPDFSVLTRDGLSVSSQSLAQKSHWLLIYRRDNCLACDRLMNAVVAGSAVQAGKGTSYAVVVVGKDKAALDKVRAAYPALVNATWVSDPSGVSAVALKLHVSPVVYGMSGKSIAWSIAGSLTDGTLVARQASAWVTNAAPTSPAVPVDPAAPPITTGSQK